MHGGPVSPSVKGLPSHVSVEAYLFAKDTHKKGKVWKASVSGGLQLLSPADQSATSYHLLLRQQHGSIWSALWPESDQQLSQSESFKPPRT